MMRCRRWDFFGRYIPWVFWLAPSCGSVFGGQSGKLVSKSTSRSFQKRSISKIIFSSLFFDTYINVLSMQFEDLTLVNAYADDLAIFCNEKSEKKLQSSYKRELKK